MAEATPAREGFVRRDATRSHLVLEVASELVGSDGWPYRQARIDLREQGAQVWSVTLFGSDGPAVIDQVARGEVHIALLNPAGPLALAVRGKGPFKEPIPLRAVTVIPSLDQLALAVSERTGLRTLSEIRERRFPLRVSLRGQKDHSVHLVVDEVLAAAGFSLSDIVSWGGEVRYDPGLPNSPDRLGAVERGEADAVFDEAVRSWLNRAVQSGMRILPLDEPVLQRLEELGLRRGVISKARFPALDRDVPTLDFSGFPVFTHANVPDGVIRSFCAALEARKARIPWDGNKPLPLETMCRDTLEGPLNIPLHPAAEQFWRERGYLP
ncbi:MAG TPA: TAXI family TRAP transporter solute-binding subunit [Candidatus Acidoferrales bacterium]|nr:TAXI family TRAP transporter solute-binding subunit [Candidatus Acidoferrales bacterium]